MAFIKSHSNYVLKKRHQDVSDGTIWERDITTIGGVNQFSPGQIPIYKSSNFIITVRNDGKISNQFNQTKWKENESGNTWTLQTISGMTSEFEDQDDVKIVLKQDYYDFCDFAYYGSLTEMFRASITDILDRFPGELYCTENEEAYYTVTSAKTDAGETIEERVRLGKNNEYLVSNPFGINIHSLKKPTDGKPLKYFADDGYKNYVLKNSEEDSGTSVIAWDVIYYYSEYDKKSGKYINYIVTPSNITKTIGDKPYPCKGDVMAEITVNGVKIKAYIGDNNEIVYLHSGSSGKRIRPAEEFIVAFYNKCDNFEKIILDRKAKYKSTFSVIQDNEKGYFRKMEEFVFPTSSGGYNVTSTDSFATRLAEIGAYYDEYFTDNLWRSMTHEAIKNFDWTYTREFTYGDEAEYVHGGEKMQKALRIFAREFDEIISYINNIKNVGRVTYDERSNIPDYFLIDEAENKGWDVCLVYPYDIKEFEADEFGDYKRDNSGNTIVISDKYDDENFQLSGDSNIKFIRQFSQNTKKEITPYDKELIDDYPEGYFISCCLDKGDKVCYYDDYSYVNASGSGSTYYDSCDGRLKNRIKSYTSDKSYTYLDANNEFMRRMVINSPYIWQNKGTIEGIEMILGMFGLKSKNWVESLYSGCTNNGVTYDYDVIEYSSFTNRLEEKWDAIHQMYRYDWINSTKAIVYDYRSTSNYTKYGAPTTYISYQGLPVSFRDEYSAATNPYLKVSVLVASAQQETTSAVAEAFKMAETNEPVFRRYLYPNFSKTEQLDGNPYFQMDGGWLAKTVENRGDTRYNFQFDVDDNIAYTYYEESGRTENDGSVVDNHPIFKETIRNIKRVDNIAELISTPIASLKEGTIYYVSNIEQGVALINNQVYPIKYEYSGKNDNPSRYILFIKNNEYIKIGDDLFFTDKIFVYDKNGASGSTSLMDKPSGFEVKAYIKNDGSFMCQGDESGYYTIDSFTILENALPPSGFTNYFVIDNPYYSNRIANVNDSGETYGWRALKETDPEYININTITNYYEGNNPHNGNMDYDSGHEYFTYFKRLFKYPMDESLFDERCYENFFVDYDNEISNIGFSGLIDDNEVIKQYTPYLISGDSKLHYFGSYYKKHDDTTPWSAITSANTVDFYGESTDKISALAEMYHYTNPEMEIEDYILNDDEKMIGGSPYSTQTGVIDEVTNQIINNKRFTIKFYLHDKWHSEQGQCELKYLDDIVMNYLTQMIPSTAIVDIQYIGKGND